MTDEIARLTAALADRYAIERELGQGGMATVYLAQDGKLGRTVALKVLRPELAASLGGERFLREIEIAAKLSHPHILPLYDCGEAAGQLFYTMPFVTGESLRDRLSREKQLPLEDALRISREVADALGYAHAVGLVHRDIKPENILFAAGHAVVADFGIAKAIAAAGSDRLTETGLAVGTPQYMSPEQAAGESALDGRSDIYSLGCVLYEMLAGEPPFTGPSVQAVVAKRLSTPAPRVSILRDRVPAHVEQALDVALARAPADRFATAVQFAEALTGEVPTRPSATATRVTRRRAVVTLGVGLGVVLVVAALTWFATTRSVGARGSAPSDSLRSVAVLPFTSLGDSTRAYLGDGFTEATIDALVRVEGLRVPASSRVLSYRGRDVRAAGRELAVRTVVTGSVQVAGNRLRVWAQLVNVDDGTTIWSLPPYDGDLAAIFTIQDSIARGVVAALRPRMTGAGGRPVGRGARTRDLEAYRLYVEGRRAGLEWTRAAVQRAITLQEQAVARDSTFADAWVGLAEAYMNSLFGYGDLPPAELAVRWRHAVERGIELDSLDGYAFAVRGWLRIMHDWDWDGARTDMRRAVRLSPASADAAGSYAGYLRIAGEPDSALAESRRALALDPANPYFSFDLARTALLAGMTDSALAGFERSLATDSTNAGARMILAGLLAARGRRAEAERETRTMLRIGGGEEPTILGWAAFLYGEVGRTDSARAMLRRLEIFGRRHYVEPSAMAFAKLAAGDRAGALDDLERAARERDISLMGNLLGHFRALDGEPRYEAVRRQVFGNLPAPRGIAHAPQ